MRHAHLAVILLPALVVSAAVLMPSTAPGFGATMVTAAQDASAVEAALGIDRPTRRLIQEGLANEGFDPGAQDGLFGPRTRAAIRAWQAARDEPQTGYLDGDQVAALLAAADPRSVTASPVPPRAPVADIPVPTEASDAGLQTPAPASRPGELPPEILIDRRLVRVDRLLARDDPRAAHDVMNEIVALQREHALALPPEFPFKYAQVAFAAGLAETAVASLNEYLLTAGRDGEFYREALELLDSAEEAVRRADAERRQAEAARERAAEERRRVTSRPAAQDDGAEEAERITRAAGAFDAVMDADDSAIPNAILERAQGLAVFPGTTRAGFGFGGMRGRGILSARSGDNWSAPAFLTLTGGSFGLQIGVQRSDIVLVIMVPEGLDNLVSNQFSIGVDAGVAAGPVGRNAAAATDLQLSAQILSYSRARGVFAGVTINGSTIRQDVDANERFYGSRLETRRVVFEGAGGTREPVGLWRQTLARYAN
jgi:lipid-binding SYLF domain-containing protein/peptidoglycan hydrolase-like protein with peptidoglycan-binding domain